MKLSFRHRCVTSLIAAGAGASGLGCGATAPASAPYQPPIEIDGGGAADMVSPDGTTSDTNEPPPPMTGPGGVRIVEGSIALLSNGPSCTGEVGATGDMWCAFLKPSALVAGSDALYVVDVTKALAGVGISCGSPAGDPNCLLLTGGFAEDSTHRASFQGNTLVYFDQTATPYGWRPGMVNGRRLVVVTSATGDVHDCVAARTGDAVACLQDVPAPVLPGFVPSTGSTTATYSDLLVGRVSATSPALARVETVISSDTADDLQRFQMRFMPPAGGRIAWSSRAKPGGPEILKVQTVGDDGSRQIVATDVSRWGVSQDDSQWAWLTAFNYDSQGPSGTLQVASFPDGASPVTVIEGAASFSFVGPHGLAVLDDRGRLFGTAEPTSTGAAQAGGPKMLDTAVIGVIGVSAQGHLAYVKDFDFVFSLVDLFVRKFDGTGPTCGLDRRTEVAFVSGLAPRFLPSGGALLWARITNLDTSDDRLIAEGKFTALSDCASSTVAPDVVTMGLLGDEAISVSDSYDGSSGTLRLRAVAPGGMMLAPGDPTLVQTRMSASLSLYPLLHALLYTVNIGASGDGLYLRPIAAASDN